MPVRRQITLPSGSNPARSRHAGDARLINCFAEPVESAKGAPGFAIYGVAGLTVWAEGGAICRGLHRVGTEKLYSVSGSAVSTYTTAAAATVLNGVVPGTDPVIMASNAATVPDVLIVCEAGLFKANATSVTLINRPDIFTSAVVSVTWINQRFVVGLEDGRFFWSGLNTTEFDALDFATAEGDPDGLVRAFAYSGTLYLFGSRSIEAWANTGGDEVFTRIGGSAIPAGLGAKHSLAVVGQRLIFVDDKGVVRRMAGGGVLERVSNYEVDRLIQAEGDYSGLTAFSYTDKGHEYYVLTGSTWTWVWDQSTGKWFERRTGLSSRWQANACEYFGGRFIVGSRENTSLYYIDESTYSEGADPLIFAVRFPVVDAFPGGAVVHALDLDFETGVGTDAGFTPRPLTFALVGGYWSDTRFTMDMENDIYGWLPDTDAVYPNRNPIVWLRYSDDGGQSWKSGGQQYLGCDGSTARVTFRRLGAFGRQGRTFEVTISASVFRALLSAHITVDPREA